MARIYKYCLKPSNILPMIIYNVHVLVHLGTLITYRGSTGAGVAIVTTSTLQRWRDGLRSELMTTVSVCPITDLNTGSYSRARSSRAASLTRKTTSTLRRRRTE